MLWYAHLLLANERKEEKMPGDIISVLVARDEASCEKPPLVTYLVSYDILQHSESRYGAVTESSHTEFVKARTQKDLEVALAMIATRHMPDFNIRINCLTPLPFSSEEAT